MTLHKIKTLLYMKKIKYAQIAEKAGVAPVTVRTVINGYRTSRRVKQAVSDLLGKPYEKLWGDLDHELIISNKKKAVND